MAALELTILCFCNICISNLCVLKSIKANQLSVAANIVGRVDQSDLASGPFESYTP
jgi:hypothetical protein